MMLPRREERVETEERGRGEGGGACVCFAETCKKTAVGGRQVALGATIGL